MTVASAKFERAMNALKADGPADDAALLADLRAAYETAKRCKEKVAAINFGQPFCHVLAITGIREVAEAVLEEVTAALREQGEDDYAEKFTEAIRAIFDKGEDGT